MDFIAGADPINSSSQGRPEQYTSDAAILELLGHAQSKMTSSGMPSHDQVYSHDTINDANHHYYAPPPQEAYTYYPTLNSAPPPMPEGVAYYPPQTPGDVGPGHMPPPEVARFIPCRYFPACRYGVSCMFAHPQAPYFQGPLPPSAQYPPYDPMSAQPYAQNYYAMPPPSFQQPNGVHHMAPLSPPPGPPMTHGRSPSEVVSPAQTHFSPNGVAPLLPYGSMSPNGYAHPGHAPVPMSLQPLPPPHHQAPFPTNGPQSPTNMYDNPIPSVPYAVPQDVAGQHPSQMATAPANYQNGAHSIKSPTLNHQPDPYGPAMNHREGMGHRRGGAARRGSFGGRKPPCLFFPAGRCKNGYVVFPSCLIQHSLSHSLFSDDCRFPHVPLEAPTHPAPYFSGRGGVPRARHHSHINGNGNVNGFGAIDEKLANMAIRDVGLFSHVVFTSTISSRVQEAPQQQNGNTNSSRSHSTDPGSRPRYFQGPKHNHNGVNGQNARLEKRPPVVKQRVPNADEFPVLTGSITPPSRSSGVNGTLPNGDSHSGPTAAQVLRAPPPARKDSTKESSTRGASPDPTRPVMVKVRPSQ